MSDPAALSDAELRDELIAFGVNVGPITATTRSIYEKQLEKRRAAAYGTSVTKTRTTSKSPSRVSRKTVTTSTVEIVHKRTPSDRHLAKVNRSESEDEAVSSGATEFENDGIVDDSDLPQDVPAGRVLRSRDITMSERSPVKQTRPQEVTSEVTKGRESVKTFQSYRTPTKDSSTKKTTNTIYPGLSPPPSVEKPTVSKLSERVPTPPRITKLNDRSSLLPDPLKTNYNTSGVFSDITADFAKQLGKRTNYTYSSNERLADARFMRNRAVNVGDDEEDDEDEDDDHMESSRIIQPSKNKASFMSSVSQIPSYAYGAVTAPFKKADHYGSTYRASMSKPPPTYALGRRSGSDIANILLYGVGYMLLLLFFGYFGIVHSEKVISASLVIAEFTKETFGMVYTYAVLPSIVIAGVVGASALLYILNQRLLSAKAARKKRVFDLVEKITDIIRESAANGQEYIAEPHVRDMLIPPSERTKGSAEWRRWQDAIRFINQNDSRVSTESRIINGVECAVWRWVPANKLGWQGNAFEGRGQLNVPDRALTHCLKLRGLFASPKDRDGAEVERELLQKLSPIKPLHIKVECGSREGVVFARFASLNDCKAAFTALHGYWFNGQLVSAKYLRDERYEQRFPNAVRNLRC